MSKNIVHPCVAHSFVISFLLNKIPIKSTFLFWGFHGKNSVSIAHLKCLSFIVFILLCDRMLWIKSYLDIVLPHELPSRFNGKMVKCISTFFTSF
jgi:hypothetical protein